MVLPSKKNPHVATVPIVKGEKNVESVLHKKKKTPYIVSLGITA